MSDQDGHRGSREVEASLIAGDDEQSARDFRGVACGTEDQPAHGVRAHYKEERQ